VHKSIPVSLGIIAFSIALIAGAVIYDRISVHNKEQATLQLYAKLAKDNALQQCRTKIATLSAELLEKQSAAREYAPKPNIKNPETLNDTQAILYRNLLASASQLKADIARLETQCEPVFGEN